MSHLITADSISKVFQTGNSEFNALKNISFYADSGESLAITGPSGSGKSTLLSILGLLDKPSSGMLRLQGQLVGDLSSYQKRILRNKEIGWIFQNFNLIGHLSALENTTLPLRYDSTINWREYEKIGVRALESVGLGENKDAPPNQLSGGQQQRVAIARALVNKPSLILADEPTGNLDSETGRKVIKLLIDTVKEGATLMLVTHDDRLAQICDREIILKDGIITNALPPATI